MNKKIFTLLAGSLMLFMAVFSTNAQTRPWVGDTVSYLNTSGNGAYHLMVTGVGTNRTAGRQFLRMDSVGFVQLIDSTTWGSRPTYQRLREALWCVTVERPNQGQVPVFTFTNKEYNINLAVLSDIVTFDSTSTIPSAAPAAAGYPQILIQKYSHYGMNPSHGIASNTGVYSSGDLDSWWFSRTYNESPLQKNMHLRIEIPGEENADFFLTFATSGMTGGEANDITLARVHKNDLLPGSDFYEDHLVHFTIVNAAPRVLDEVDFNTKLGTLAKQSLVDLKFFPDVSTGQENVFSKQPLWAEHGDGSGDHQYLHVRTGVNSGDYVYVTDDPDEYHNEVGFYYPTIKTGPKQNNGSDQFRFVYYPSEDSIIINVKDLRNHPNNGHKFDNLVDNYDLGDQLYNINIWNYLMVRRQNLTTSATVLTIGDQPANTRVYFDIKDCKVYDANRTTIEPDLYTVRDSRGRYLVVPLVNGDFTPQWRNLTVDTYGGNRDTIEKALKTPAYQWFVTKVKKDSNTSRIFLTNREFDFIRLEYVQIYTTPTKFHASWRFLTDSLNPGATYVVNDQGALVSASGFQVVKDDAVAAKKKADLIAQYGTNKVGTAKHQVEAWMQYMPQDLMQKLYRTSPFLGYKAIMPDTLNFYGYSFNYLHKYSDEFYFGVTEKNNSNNDSTLYVDKDRTFFELLLPDSLRAYGREVYGIGNEGSNNLYTQNGKGDIAVLERYFYHFKINDYYKFDWNDNFLVLDYAGNYAYTDEANANARELNKAKFYMRFTHEVGNTEYYSLLDRIDKSNFEFLTRINADLKITNILKYADASHGTITQNSFGVIQAAVQPNSLVVKGQVKTLDETNSTFAIGQMQDILYRRFNTELEDCGRGAKDDEPRILKFHRYYNDKEFLYENNHGPYNVPNSGIHFLGVENVTTCNVENGHWHADHNYAIYVDTAYVNRGTGHIKPQYMLVMNPKIEVGGRGCDACGDSINFQPYVYGRYLRNMSDSARVNGTPGGAILNKNYLTSSSWERLAFTEAIHSGDYLYILNGTPITALYAKDADGKQYLNFALMDDYPNIKAVFLGNNFHKDEVFSMRFVERQTDQFGNNINNPNKSFYIESETTNRDFTKGRMIAPMIGGWVKWNNSVPAISRGSYHSSLEQGDYWDVMCAGLDEEPTNNDEVAATKVTVVAGNGSVTILNATGKRAIITNVLGQTIANEVLTSDNVDLSAPKGVIVVSVEGEDAVKTIVK